MGGSVRGEVDLLSPKSHSQVVGLPVDMFVNVTVDGAVGDDKPKVKFATGPAGAMIRWCAVAVFGVTPFETVKLAKVRIGNRICVRAVGSSSVESMTVSPFEIPFVAHWASGRVVCEHDRLGRKSPTGTDVEARPERVKAHPAVRPQ